MEGAFIWAWWEAHSDLSLTRAVGQGSKAVMLIRRRNEGLRLLLLSGHSVWLHVVSANHYLPCPSASRGLQTSGPWLQIMFSVMVSGGGPDVDVFVSANHDWLTRLWGGGRYGHSRVR